MCSYLRGGILRRYEVAWVRRRGVGRALPRAYLQADLDIVTLPGSTPSETLLADAEVIRAVSEVSSTHLSSRCSYLLRSYPMFAPIWH